MGVGLSISKLRQERGLSVQGLANRAGLARGTIYNIERWDRTPRSDVLQKLALALEVDARDLLYEVTTSYQSKLRNLGVSDLRWTLAQMPDLEESDREFILEYARERGIQNRRRTKAVRTAASGTPKAEKATIRIDHLDPKGPPGVEQSWQLVTQPRLFKDS